jgi:hypothetical protein
MKHFKSDRRYKNFANGYHYVIDFRWTESKLYMEYTEACNKLYGDARVKILNEDGTIARDSWGLVRARFNENYRLEINRSQKRRRIYLKDESNMLILALTL